MSHPKSNTLDKYFSRANTNKESERTRNTQASADEPPDNDSDCDHAKKRARRFHSEWLGKYTWLRKTESEGMKCDICLRAGTDNPFTTKDVLMVC